ncbi:MAG: DUF3298 domain-containing protein [Bacteroidales bacterium]|nr:DUF3298 domain-containing protein [Bacteroidales bacterium]
MKKILTIILVCILVIAFGVMIFFLVMNYSGSGSQTPSPDEKTVCIDDFSFDSIDFHQHLDTTPSLAIDIVLHLPVANPDIPVSAVLRRNIIADVLGQKYLCGDAPESIKAYVGELNSSFRSSMDEMDFSPSDLNDEGISYMYSWEESLRSSIFIASSQILVTKTTFYSYTGGAHGFGGDNYCVYSLLNGKRLSLGDIFLSDSSSRAAVSKFLHSALRSLIANDEDYRDMEVFSWDDVKPVENFYVSSKGITFVYLPYDIAAYCYGQISLTLPFAAVQPYLIPESPVYKYFSNN